MSCLGDCLELGPPPDMILSMPPPPLSSFLLPKNALVASGGGKPNGNSNNSLLCSAAFICEPSLKAIEQSGMEFIELPGNGMDDTWVLVLISSCVGVLLLGALLAMILIKCRDRFCFRCSSFNYSYHDSNLKQPPLHTLGSEPSAAKAAVFMPGGTILYPTGHVQHHHGHHHHQHNHQQHQPVYAPTDNRTLWAALTPHGTQHFITESYGTGHPEDHYEVIDYGRKHEQYIPSAHGTIVKSKNSFENSGFVDYDYEDPTPLMESYAHFDDMDSGYQEPQEVLGSLKRGGLAAPAVATHRTTTMVSSPTRIENPNLPPLNLYPTVQSHRGSAAGTLGSTMGRKSAGGSAGAGTLSRRISDIKN